MNSTQSKPRIYVYLRSTWGAGSAESTVKVSRRRWKQIQEGKKFEIYGTSWYEGARESVCWEFKKGRYSISGAWGRECVVDEPIASIYADIR